MKWRLIPIAALLCAMPAQGDNEQLTERVRDLLTPIDAVPSKAALNEAFTTPQIALDNLRLIALDSTVDLGIALRAIRMLPAYCPEDQVCGPGTLVHDTLTALIDSYRDPMRTPRTPQNRLRVRAAIEALGAAKSGLATDVTQLTQLLEDDSRDVRATVVRALRSLCNVQAIDPLSTHYKSETSDQVRRAISSALRDLRQCN